MGGERSPIRYRGPERRSTPSPRGRARPLDVARDLVGLLALGIAAVAAATLAERLVPEAVPAVALLLGGLGTGLCFVVVSGCFIRWRLVGDGVAIRVALAFAVYGTSVAPLVARTADGPLGTLVETLGTAIAVVVLVAAASAPEVDGGFRATRAAGGLGLGMVAAVGTLAAVPEVAPYAAAVKWGGWPVAGGATAAMAAAAAGVLAVAGVRRDRRLLAVVGVALVALAAAPVAMAVRIPAASGPLSASALQLVGLLLVVRTTATDARHALSTAARYDIDLRLRWRDAVDEAQQATRTQHEHSHEIRSGLLAVEGAGQVLARRLEDLGDRADAGLAVALQQEASRLRRIAAVADDDPPMDYNVLEALVPLVDTHRACGQRISLDVPPSLRAAGRPHALAEVMSNLLVNCERHAPGSSVTIASVAGAAPDRLTLVVADDGPGFSGECLRHATERGWRATPTGVPGSGLGLFLASRLMAEEGGGLTLVPPPRGGVGAVVALDLPRQCTPVVAVAPLVSVAPAVSRLPGDLADVS